MIPASAITVGIPAGGRGPHGSGTSSPSRCARPRSELLVIQSGIPNNGTRPTHWSGSHSTAHFYPRYTERPGTTGIQDRTRRGRIALGDKCFGIVELRGSWLAAPHNSATRAPAGIVRRRPYVLYGMLLDSAAGRRLEVAGRITTTDLVLQTLVAQQPHHPAVGVARRRRRRSRPASRARPLPIASASSSDRSRRGKQQQACLVQRQAQPRALRQFVEWVRLVEPEAADAGAPQRRQVATRPQRGPEVAGQGTDVGTRRAVDLDVEIDESPPAPPASTSNRSMRTGRAFSSTARPSRASR